MQCHCYEFQCAWQVIEWWQLSSSFVWCNQRRRTNHWLSPSMSSDLVIFATETHHATKSTVVCVNCCLSTRRAFIPGMLQWVFSIHLLLINTPRIFIHIHIIYSVDLPVDLCNDAFFPAVPQYPLGSHKKSRIARQLRRSLRSLQKSSNDSPQIRRHGAFGISMPLRISQKIEKITESRTSALLLSSMSNWLVYLHTIFIKTNR